MHTAHTKITRYHKFLRTMMVVVACLLIADSGMYFPITKQLSNVTTQYVASVTLGTDTSITENTNNTPVAPQNEKNDYSTFILSVIQFILILLIVFNYVLDFIRAREMRVSHVPA